MNNLLLKKFSVLHLNINNILIKFVEQNKEVQ